MEAQVNDLQARLNDAVNQRKHWENEYHVSDQINGSVQDRSNSIAKEPELQQPSTKPTI